MKENIFEKVIDNLDWQLSENYLPKRLEILAKGFANRLSSSQVNEALNENDCESLYARSSFEASLIFAYDHGLSYQKWQELYERSQEILKNSSRTESVFKGGRIRLKQLEQYVFEGSDDMLRTRMVTQLLVNELNSQNDEQDFFDFMADNSMKFSVVREAARYYFCKYLYHYIREKCDRYYHACSISKSSEKQALEELTFLKPLTKLRKEADKVKAKMTLEEKKEYLENASLTPGGIFDEFNYFYFGYVSADWLELLFELYDDFSEWPKEDRIRIARGVGLLSHSPSESETEKALEKLAEMAEEERLRQERLDMDYEKGGKEVSKSYQRGRVGEDYFRDFILGRKDINRSTLIFFLMFVNARIKLGDDSKITIPRLNRILLKCGMPQLRPDRQFDSFVLKYMKAKNPMDVIEDEVEELVTNGKDFYLYQVYSDAYCHQNELVKYLIQ